MNRHDLTAVFKIMDNNRRDMMKHKQVYFLLALLFVCIHATSQETGILKGTVLDSTTQNRTPCTVQIHDANNKIVIENESYLDGFRCNGQFEKTLPVGKTKIRVTRGFETKSVEQTIDIKPNQTSHLDFELERIIDLRAQGWFAGDHHAHMVHGERTIHTDFDAVALAVHAEDLHHFSLSHAWLLDYPSPETLTAILQERSSPNCNLTWNIEAPKNYYKGSAGACIGHGWYIGAKHRTKRGESLIDLLLQSSAGDYESHKPSIANFEIHELIHHLGGTCYYTHPARWWWGSWGGHGGYPKLDRMRVSNLAVELPLDTVIGPTYEGIDVMMTTNESSTNAKGFKLWCLLQNHGYRVAATASSDSCFDRRNGGRPGAVRTYVYLGNTPFSFSDISKAMAQGHTFITSGPLLVVKVNGKFAGNAFVADGSDRTMQIEAWAAGNDPGGLTKVELYRNGKLHQEFNLSQRKEWTHSIKLNDQIDAWYCVRAFGSNPKHQIAQSGAFYFDTKPFVPPKPVPANIQATIVDEETGDLIEGQVTEIQYVGPNLYVRESHQTKDGKIHLPIPATYRLRAEAKGYYPQILSPLFDNPDLLNIIIRMHDTDMLDWNTYEKIISELNDVQLTFKLKKQ
jgi:hypothetical protein